MKCRDVQIRLQLFLDGELSQNESHAVRAHLQECASCAKVKSDFEFLTRLAQTEPTAKAPGNFDRLLQQRMGKAESRKRRLSWLPTPVAWSAAALVVTALFAVSGFVGIRYVQTTDAGPLPASAARVTSVVLPADPGTPGTHVYVPGEQDGMLVQVPSTVTITRSQLTQDFFLSEVSH
jgi:anti-sigma factor RsiW